MTLNTKDMGGAGYSHEEEYFYKMNKELIEKRRHLNDQERAAQINRDNHVHWMMCPKCGGNLKKSST